MTDREWAITWIEAIKEKYIHGGDESYDDCRRRSIDMAIEALKQPEIVRCKDCKKRYTVLCIQEEAGNINNQDDWFCADGKKKVKWE